MHPFSSVSLVALVVLTGCVTAEGVLRADGSARIELLYVPGRHATVQSETRRLGAEHVLVEALAPRDRYTAATLHAQTVDALGDVPAFDGATITRARDGAAERLTIRVAPPDARQRAYLAWVRQKQPDAMTAELSVQLPGRALAADGRGTIDGDRVRWQVTLDEWATSDAIELWVRWAASPDAPARPTSAHSM